VVLYGCETWSLTVKEEHRLKVFENRVTRRTFRMKRNEVTIGWRILHIEELRALYSSPYVIRTIKSRRMRWTGRVANVREKRAAYSLLVRKPEGKRTLGRPRCKWVDYIKIDVREVVCGDVDWIDLAQDRVKW
jgi:hypothetical protein